MLLCMTAIAIVGGYSYFSAKRALMNRTYDQLASVRYLKKKEIESFYRMRINDIELLAADKSLFNPEYSAAEGGIKMSPSVIRMLLADGYFHRLFIYSGRGWFSLPLKEPEKGSPTATSSLPAGLPLADTMTLHKPYISDLVADATGEGWIQYISYCSLSNTHQKVVLILELLSSGIDSIMSDYNPLNGLGKSGEVYLAGSDRYMRSSSRFVPGAILKMRIDTATAHLGFSGQDGTWLMNDYRGIKVLGSFSLLSPPFPAWVVIAEIDKKEVMLPVRAIRNNVIFITVFIALLIFAASWFISVKITGPLVKLRKAALDLGSGNLGTHVIINTNDEIGELAGSFNAMSSQLREKETQLEKERNRRMKAAFDGQDTERQRLSRELHDSIGQSLIAQKLRLESIKSASGGQVPGTLNELIANTDQLVDEVRRISNDLMPAQLNRFGLIPALQQHCDEVSRISMLEINFEATGEFEPMSRKARIYLFRIVQEALTNIVKHSAATTASIELSRTRDFLFLSISDNGKGFVAAGECPGNGLNNMRERTHLLSGSFSILSGEGAGCIIEIKIPMKYEQRPG